VIADIRRPRIGSQVCLDDLGASRDYRPLPPDSRQGEVAR
jgi:hypothetical protein